MDQFKITNFQNANPHGLFPSHQPLDDEQCGALRRQLQAILKLQGNDYSAIFGKLTQRARRIDNANAEDDQFDLRASLKDFVDRLPEKVLINWGRLDNVDRMRFVDLAEHFSDIWYPSSDDIEVFDESLTWACIVSHDGMVSVAILNETPDATGP